MKTPELLLNFLFPSVCCFCGEITAYDRAVCKRCKEALAPISGITCSVCGMERGMCRCAEEPSEFERCIASFYYETEAKAGVLLLKYGELPYIARYLSVYMARQVKRRCAGVRFDLAAAVPMHRLKHRVRGYNQAEALARPLAKRLGIAFERDVLEQVRENEPQHQQKHAKRAQNVAGIYRLGKRTRVRGKTVLLVDDISTTGSTLRECARVLKDGGASMVYCAVFCATKPINT